MGGPPRPDSFPAGRNRPSVPTEKEAGWGTTAELNVLEKQKISYPSWDLNPGSYGS